MASNMEEGFKCSEDTPKLVQNKHDYLVKDDAFVTFFEGSSDNNDKIKFQEYKGERTAQQKYYNVSYYEISLVSPNLRMKNTCMEFIPKFVDRMEYMRSKYKSGEDGNIRITARFGKLYFWDGQYKNQPRGQMTITELKEQTRQLGRTCSSRFCPQDISHCALEPYLQQNGFEKMEEEKKSCNVAVLPQGFETPFRVMLDKNLQFHDFRYSSTKWLNASIVRYEKERRDIRISVESFNLKVDEQDPEVNKYKSASLLYRNDNNEIKINEKYLEEVKYVKERQARRYIKIHKGSDRFKAEIHLIRSREHGNWRNKYTERYSLQSTDWTEEAVIYSDLPDINNAEEIEEFAKWFLKLCFEIENLA